MKRYVQFAVLLAGLTGLLSLGGCAATSVALQHKDLTVQSAVSKTIFLPMSSDKTFAIAVRNSSTNSVGSAILRDSIIKGLEDKGYTLVQPEQAHYQIQLNIVSANEVAQAAGGGVGGALLGASAGGFNGNGQGALIGGVIGGVADMVAGALVKNVTIAMTSELQIAVRQPHAVSTSETAKAQQGTGAVQTQVTAGQSDFVDYQTTIRSWMNQVNLKFPDALPQLRAALVRNVVGLF